MGRGRGQSQCPAHLSGTGLHLEALLYPLGEVAGEPHTGGLLSFLPHHTFCPLAGLCVPLAAGVLWLEPRTLCVLGKDCAWGHTLDPCTHFLVLLTFPFHGSLERALGELTHHPAPNLRPKPVLGEGAVCPRAFLGPRSLARSPEQVLWGPRVVCRRGL